MRQRLILRGIGLVAVATAACFALHAGFEHLLAASVPAYAPLRSGVEHAVMILVALLFLAVLVFQSQLPAWASRPGTMPPRRWISKMRLAWCRVTATCSAASGAIRRAANRA